MRYPNLRYGSAAALAYYTQGVPIDQVAHQLRRDQRTIRDWISGAKRVPFWVPELVRLQYAEKHRELVYMMGELAPALRPVFRATSSTAANDGARSSPAEQRQTAGTALPAESCTTGPSLMA